MRYISEDSFFTSNHTIHKSFAPGRLDVMGGIADYSGSLLLQMPIKATTRVSLQSNDQDYLEIYSKNQVRPGTNPLVTISLPDLWESVLPMSLGLFKNMREAQWASYVAGAWIVLSKAKGIKPGGARIWIETDVPIAKGVSSSASLEVAVLLAMRSWQNLKFDHPYELALLAQQIENEVVGAPCGLMDQLAVCFGKQGMLSPITCQPYLVESSIPVPEGMYFAGIDSGVRHDVGGHSYGEVRAAAFMGYSILAQMEGTSAEKIRTQFDRGDRENLPFGGYLANLSLDDFETKYKDRLPDMITGLTYLQQYGESIDPQTTIDPDKNYSVRNCTSHPIYENARVNRFKSVIENIDSHNDQMDFELLGNLMYESHWSYSNCGLGHEKTDQLVRMSMQRDRYPGIYGAKITGGGSGGTVCFLLRGEEGVSAAKLLKTDFERMVGYPVGIVNL